MQAFNDILTQEKLSLGDIQEDDEQQINPMKSGGVTKDAENRTKELEEIKANFREARRSIDD